jgi:DNA-directed RNA polymerase specialized sigma24 family protein
MDVTVEDNEKLVERFESHRAHLRAVAYRMLGSLARRTMLSRKLGCDLAVLKVT